jgi:uncharacterized protein
MLKASRYNVEAEQPEPGAVVIYNTLYGSMTACSREEAPVVRAILRAEVPAGDGTGEAWQTLKRQQHLVPATRNEVRIVERRKRLGIRDANRLDVILLPTLQCNFACKYCYETPRPSRMGAATEAAIGAWLSSQIPRFKLTLLHWFGGEPLLAHRQVVSLSRTASKVAQRAGVSCALHITTNGYLLTPNRAAELLDAGIRDYQITVDGPPETHDRLRVLRGGGGTFARVFGNLIALARADTAVQISLRVNFNHTNLESIPTLLALVPEDARPRIRLALEPIFGSCTLSATDNIASTAISDALARYYALGAQMGFAVSAGSAGLVPGRFVYCYAERENQLVIDHHGDVYKCTVTDFRPEDRVGRIIAGGVLVKDSVAWDRWVTEGALFEAKCYECAYLPLCMGGCRKMRLRSAGTGSFCSLVPTNASQLLKQVAFGGFERLLATEAERFEGPRRCAGTCMQSTIESGPHTKEGDR